jgi:protein SCO1/2
MQAAHTMKSRVRFLIIFALALSAAGTAAVALLMVSPVPKVSTSGTAVVGGPFRLVATDGQDVSDQAYRGKWLLLFFGYTFCPDVCPTALSNISGAIEKLGSGAENLQPLFITVDPQRDTREVMKDYLQSFDPRIIGLTGTQDQIDRIVKDYRVYVTQEKPESNNNDYLVSHSAYIYLMDPQRKFVNVIEGSEAGETIAAWLRKEIRNSKLSGEGDSK